MTLTVGKLKEKLMGVLDDLDCYDDDAKVKTVTNTYFINSNFFAQVGYDGFVDLANIELDDEDYDDDDEMSYSYKPGSRKPARSRSPRAKKPSKPKSRRVR